MLLWPPGRPFKELVARLLGYSLIKTKHFLKKNGVFTLPPPSALHFCFVIVPLFLKEAFYASVICPLDSIYARKASRLSEPLNRPGLVSCFTGKFRLAPRVVR